MNDNSCAIYFTLDHKHICINHPNDGRWIGSFHKSTFGSDIISRRLCARGWQTELENMMVGDYKYEMDLCCLLLRQLACIQRCYLEASAHICGEKHRSRIILNERRRCAATQITHCCGLYLLESCKTDILFMYFWKTLLTWLTLMISI